MSRVDVAVDVICFLLFILCKSIAHAASNKKADVVKPKGFHRVGLLFNSPTDLNQLAIYLVVRMPQTDVSTPRIGHISPG